MIPISVCNVEVTWAYGWAYGSSTHETASVTQAKGIILVND